MDIKVGGNRFTEWLRRGDWAKLGGSILLIIGVAFLLFWRIGHLVPVLSPSEITFTDTTHSIHQLIKDPINAPVRAVDYTLRLIHFGNIITFRTVSAVFAVVALYCFYILMLNWHTRRMSIFGTILLSSSSWFLSVGRTATADILLVTMPLLLIMTSYLTFRKKAKLRSLAYLALIASTALALYVPFMFWLVLIIYAVYWRQLYMVLKKVPKKAIIAGSVVLIIGLFPLIYGIIHDWHIVLRLTGIPETWLPIKQYGIHAKEITLSLAYRTVPHPELRLGTLPLLDAVSAILLILGLYYYWLRRHSYTAIMLVILGVISFVLLVLSPHPAYDSMALLIPVSYIAVVAGLTLLLQQWFTIFPRNNIARGIGVGIVSLLVAMCVFYHFERYFVAWPQSPETKKAFSLTSH